MIRGVRGRIALLATAIMLLVLALTGAALVVVQRSVLTDNVDEVLQRHSAAIALDIDAGTLTDPLPGQGDDESFAQVVDGEGRVVASTSHDPDSAELGTSMTASTHYRNARLKDGLEYRVLSQRHGPVSIRTGTPLDDVNDSVATLTRGLVIAVPAAALLLAVLVWILVGRVLRPVEEIRRQVTEITGISLDRRVPEPDSRDEIARLAHTMNEMLERVEASAVRQRRFVADASHELRSPIARIRAELEVDLAHPSSANLGATHRRVLEDAETLQRLVDDLLTVARSDGSRGPGRRALVDLDDVVMREAARLRASGRAEVDVSGVSGAQVTGDVSQLARVVRNLLDNAAQHGGPNIAVALGEENGEAILSVTDDGVGIPAQLQEQVFEPFARVDEARTGSQGGSGLGLAITRELVAAHGGSVRIDPGHRPGARFVVRLPVEGGNRRAE